MSSATRLVHALRDPSTTAGLAGREWTGLIAAARAESLLGSLAHRLEPDMLPAPVTRVMDVARSDAEEARRQALWEAEMARRALAPLGVPVVLLKGTAYAAAGLQPAVGRSIGDLDILVPRAALSEVEAALLGAGWEWVKEDPYDDSYYRQWMHELPPLIHRERDRMIDVHHTILPLTARPRPDADALIAESIAVEEGLRVLSPPDMLIHAAAHLLADGDLAGGLRNLWDIDRMLRDFGAQPGFWERLDARARLHGLSASVMTAARLAARLYGTPIDDRIAGRPKPFDGVLCARLLARDGWGRRTRPALRLGFYIRSHLLRMPPLMLARHLWVKSRR